MDEAGVKGGKMSGEVDGVGVELLCGWPTAGGTIGRD